MAVSDTLIGSLFDGRYKILRRLGAGGMANVYLAEDQELGRRIAIKILNDRHAHDDQFVERFRREAQNAAGLSHPNIVSIYDRGEAEGTYYIAMEYLGGRSLKELIVSRGPAPVKLAVDYARQILAALRFAHRNGVVHRDIKPHNIVVDSEGRLKVTDFGIARAGVSQMTEAGSIIGTAQYLSPEQAKGAPVDQTSDLYSLGIVLYELLTGQVPFTGDTPVEIAMKHLSQTPQPPSALRADVPQDLDWIVMRALAKDPADRYQDADEMDADLARVGQGLSVSSRTEDAATQIIARPTTLGAAPTGATVVQARPTPTYAPPPPVYYDYDEPIRRRPIWPWLVALLFVVGAVVGGFFLYNQVSDQLNANKPVAVDRYVGERETLAVQNIHGAHLKPHVVRKFDDKTPETYVFDQDPQPGSRLSRGGSVTVFVSLGKPKTEVPDVVGKKSDEAVGELTAANLTPRVVEINSDRPAGTVLAQDPAAGKKVVEGTKVRINVSKGPKPIGVPSVVGQPFDSANGILQGAGFRVSRVDVASTQPKGIVTAQNPAPNTFQGKGTTITLNVSKGPTTSTVPDVTSQDQATAISNLQGSGFKARVVRQDTADATQDGIVLDQTPPGATQAKPGTTVTITVGRFTGDTTTGDTTTTPTTP